MPIPLNPPVVFPFVANELIVKTVAEARLDELIVGLFAFTPNEPVKSAWQFVVATPRLNPARSRRLRKIVRTINISSVDECARQESSNRGGPDFKVGASSSSGRAICVRYRRVHRAKAQENRKTSLTALKTQSL
jgi:hypothetical protein